MKPVDYRNATWKDIQDRLDRNRREVWQSLLSHGPATTRELARHMRWDILAVRPRVTELVQLGLARLQVIGGVTMRRAHEGVYEALTEAEAMALHAARVREARREVQPALL